MIYSKFDDISAASDHLTNTKARRTEYIYRTPQLDFTVPASKTHLPSKSVTMALHNNSTLPLPTHANFAIANRPIALAVDPAFTRYNSTNNTLELSRLTSRLSSSPFTLSICSALLGRRFPKAKEGLTGAGALTDMQNNRHKYFRWTARSGWLTVAYVVAFPAFIGYLGVVTDVSLTHSRGWREGGEAWEMCHRVGMEENVVRNGGITYWLTFLGAI